MSANYPRFRYEKKRLGIREVVLIAVILLLPGALIGPGFFGHHDGPRLAKSKSDISELSGAITRFLLDIGRYPTNLEGFSALLKPTGGPKWSGPYVEGIPNDEWGHPYTYRYFITKDSHGSSTPGFEVKSLGADGKPGGEGADADISSLDGQRP